MFYFVRYSSVAIERASSQGSKRSYVRVTFDSNGDIIARRRFEDFPIGRLRGVPFNDLAASKAPILGERCYQIDANEKW